MSGLDKDNTGYDLTATLIGSEGTLGVITRAELRLVRRPAETVTAMVRFDALADAVAAAWTLRRHDPGLEVVELVDGPCLELIADHTGVASPVGSSGAALLVESAGESDPAPHLAAAVDRCQGVVTVAVATSVADRERLWGFRDGITARLTALGPVSKFDVSLPPDVVVAFCSDVLPRIAALPGARRVWVFGHVCDGNLHVNVTGAAVPDDELEELVLGEVIARGGSISAEHGIGRAKAHWLERMHPAAEVAAMRAVKTALDPELRLNPGVIFG
jgi:FAD/FMN-containing dehydrogenase